MKRNSQPFERDPKRCQKISYSYSEANRMINQAHKHSWKHRNRRKKIPKRAYHCERCGTWHLTSQKRRSISYKDDI